MFYKNKSKKLTISLAVLFLLFIGFSFVSAQFTPEVKYPEIGTKTITRDTTLQAYIEYIFSLAIIIGVLIAVGSLIYGGFLHLTSAGIPAQMTAARSRILSSLLGLVILLGSYLILNTVNPELLTIKIVKFEVQRGVKLILSADKDEITEISIEDIQEKYGDDFKPTKVKILGTAVGELKVMAFSEPDYKGTTLTNWITNGLPTAIPFIIKSLEVRGIGPGVYLYGAPQDRQELYLNRSLGTFTEIDNFDDKAEKIEIKNLANKQTDFAAILYADPYFEDEFKIFFEERVRPGDIRELGNVTPDNPDTPNNEGMTDIVSIDNYGKVTGVSSAYIFQIGDEEKCQEIRLFQEPNFISTETSPYCRITSTKTTLVYFRENKDGTTEEIIKDISTFKLPIYEPIDIKDACGNDFKDAVQGIEIPGKCVVVLFEHSTSAGNFPGKRSEVFAANDPDLSDNASGKCKCLNGILGWLCQPCASAIAVYPKK